MFFNMNITPVWLDIYIGNQLVQQQQMTMPDQMLAAQFMQMCKQVANDPQPIHVVMRRYDDVWNQAEGKMEQRECKLEYWNKQEVW
jgi:hypothetical protein